MKNLIVYFTQGGTTAKVAEAIAAGFAHPSQRGSLSASGSRLTSASRRSVAGRRLEAGPVENKERTCGFLSAWPGQHGDAC